MNGLTLNEVNPVEGTPLCLALQHITANHPSVSSLRVQQESSRMNLRDRIDDLPPSTPGFWLKRWCWCLCVLGLLRASRDAEKE